MATMANKKLNKFLLSLGINVNDNSETKWLSNNVSLNCLKFEYKPSESEKALEISEEEFASVINNHKVQYGVLQYYFDRNDRTHCTLNLFVDGSSYTCKGFATSILSKIPNLRSVGSYIFGSEESVVQRIIVEFYRDQTFLDKFKSKLVNILKHK